MCVSHYERVDGGKWPDFLNWQADTLGDTRSSGGVGGCGVGGVERWEDWGKFDLSAIYPHGDRWHADE